MSKANDSLEDLSEEIKRLETEVDYLTQFNPETALAAFGDNNDELRRELSRAALLLADAEGDRDENYMNWMGCKQKVLHGQVTIDELSAENAKLRELAYRVITCCRNVGMCEHCMYMEYDFDGDPVCRNECEVDRIARELGIEVGA